jgi:thiamine transport system ATP-binding protein
MLKAECLVALRESRHFEWSFEVGRGQLMAVVGESGIGKSTLISTLLGFHPVESGAVYWNGQLLNQLPVSDRPFGVLFQQNNLFEHLTVYQNMALGLNINAKLSERERESLSLAAERFGLTSLLKKRASNLSGGQQQRVALARVFLQHKPVLLLDEPFSSLDKHLRDEGIQWVKDMQAEHSSTVILVTHHLEEITSYVDSVLQATSSSQWHQLTNKKFFS